MTDPAGRGTRTRRAGLILGGAAVLLIGGLALALLAPRFKKIERRASPAPLVVQTTLPADIDRVAADVRSVFNDEQDLDQGTHRLPRDDFFSRFYLFPRAHPIFPDAFQIQYWAKKDSYLRPYAELADTTHDFYLYEPSGDRYWSSDYYYNGVPAPFRCAFFIHLEPRPDGGTAIAVFEYLPTIWIGERIGFSAHAIGPTSLHDIRFVESTNRDRIQLLQKIRESPGN